MIRQAWDKLGKLGQWATGIASGVATLVAAYFAVSGFVDHMDTWIVTEAEAAEQLQQQLKVLEEYRQDLAYTRTQHQIDSIRIDLDRVNLQIRYLNNIEDRDADEELELQTLIEYRADLQKQLKTLRCIAAGNDPDECSV